MAACKFCHLVHLRPLSAQIQILILISSVLPVPVPVPRSVTSSYVLWPFLFFVPFLCCLFLYHRLETITTMFVMCCIVQFVCVLTMLKKVLLLFSHSGQFTIYYKYAFIWCRRGNPKRKINKKIKGMFLSVEVNKLYILEKNLLQYQQHLVAYQLL